MHRTETKDRLILSLMELASERGLANVSFSLLAASAGIAKASVFQHFANRKEMEDELFAYGSRLASRREFTISLEGSASEVLFRAMDSWHGICGTTPLKWFYRIVETEKLVDARADRLAKSFASMIEAQSRVMLETLSDSGRMDIAELDLATLMFGATARTFLLRVMTGGDEDAGWQEERFVLRFCRQYGGM